MSSQTSSGPIDDIYRSLSPNRTVPVTSGVASHGVGGNACSGGGPLHKFKKKLVTMTTVAGNNIGNRAAWMTPPRRSGLRQQQQLRGSLARDVSEGTAMTDAAVYGDDEFLLPPGILPRAPSDEFSGGLSADIFVVNEESISTSTSLSVTRRDTSGHTFDRDTFLSLAHEKGGEDLGHHRRGFGKIARQVTPESDVDVGHTGKMPEPGFGTGEGSDEHSFHPMVPVTNRHGNMSHGIKEQHDRRQNQHQRRRNNSHHEIISHSLTSKLTPTMTLTTPAKINLKPRPSPRRTRSGGRKMPARLKKNSQTHGHVRKKSDDTDVTPTINNLTNWPTPPRAHLVGGRKNKKNRVQGPVDVDAVSITTSTSSSNAESSDDENDVGDDEKDSAFLTRVYGLCIANNDVLKGNGGARKSPEKNPLLSQGQSIYQGPPLRQRALIIGRQAGRRNIHLEPPFEKSMAAFDACRDAQHPPPPPILLNPEETTPSPTMHRRHHSDGTVHRSGSKRNSEDGASPGQRHSRSHSSSCEATLTLQAIKHHESMFEGGNEDRMTSTSHKKTELEHEGFAKEDKENDCDRWFIPSSVKQMNKPDRHLQSSMGLSVGNVVLERWRKEQIAMERWERHKAQHKVRPRRHPSDEGDNHLGKSSCAGDGNNMDLSLLHDHHSKSLSSISKAGRRHSGGQLSPTEEASPRSEGMRRSGSTRGAFFFGRGTRGEGERPRLTRDTSQRQNHLVEISGNVSVGEKRDRNRSALVESDTGMEIVSIAKGYVHAH